MKYFLYKLTFPNGKVYIGQTNNFEKRMNGHKNEKRVSRNCQVNNAIRKYGWENVLREVIAVSTESEIDALERNYISILDSTNRARGYNREGGGNSRKVVLLETRRLISLSRMGKKQWSKPVLQIDPLTQKTVRKWESVASAGRALGVSQSTISTICNNRKKVCYIKNKAYFSSPKVVGGFTWAFSRNLTIT